MAINQSWPDEEWLFAPLTDEVNAEKERRAAYAMPKLARLHQKLADADKGGKEEKKQAERVLALCAEVSSLVWTYLDHDRNLHEVLNAVERAQGVMQIILKALQSTTDWQCYGPGSIGPRSLLREAIDDLCSAIASFREAARVRH